MPFYGDRGGKVYFPNSHQNTQMSTTIARIYTLEGFAIASDGRKTRSDTCAIMSDSQQKIFSIEQNDRCLGYALSRTVQLTHRESESVMFDYMNEFSAAAAELSNTNPRSLRHYATELAQIVAESADDKITNEIDPVAEGKETIVSIDGYYNGRPESVRIHFTNHIAKSIVWKVEVDDVIPGQMLGFGSRELFTLVPAGDARFSKYRVEVRDPQRISLVEGILMVGKMIDAHMDPEAEKLHPDNYRTTGGKVQVASITLENGFQWIDYASMSPTLQT